MTNRDPSPGNSTAVHTPFVRPPAGDSAATAKRLCGQTTDATAGDTSLAPERTNVNATHSSVGNSTAAPGRSGDRSNDERVAETHHAPFVLDNVTTETSRMLEDCAVQIDLAKSTMAWKVIEIGKLLASARGLLRYEEGFTSWVQTRCGFSVSHAYRYIQAFDKFGSFSTLGKIQSSAIFLLASGATPESARDEAVRRAQSGEPITHATAKKIIQNAKDKSDVAVNHEEIPDAEGTKATKGCDEAKVPSCHFERDVDEDGEDPTGSQAGSGHGFSIGRPIGTASSAEGMVSPPNQLGSRTPNATVSSSQGGSNTGTVEALDSANGKSESVTSAALTIVRPPTHFGIDANVNRPTARQVAHRDLMDVGIRVRAIRGFAIEHELFDPAEMCTSILEKIEAAIQMFAGAQRDPQGGP